MNLTDKVAATAKYILNLFKDPSKLPGAIAQIMFDLGDSPAGKRSWGNRLLAHAQTGTVDLRTYKQWKSVGRFVKSADDRASGLPYILRPLTRRYEVEEDGKKEKRAYVYGFGTVPVFPAWDTDGESDLEQDLGIESSKLVKVAEAWGLSVSPVKGDGASLAWYRPGQKMIGLATRNIDAFAHELVHAAEDRLGRLTVKGQDPLQEVVAEMGSAVLLCLLGYETEADLGGAYKYIKAYASDGDALKACNRVINRVGDAVSLILAEEV